MSARPALFKLTNSLHAGYKMGITADRPCTYTSAGRRSRPKYFGRREARDLDVNGTHQIATQNPRSTAPDSRRCNKPACQFWGLRHSSTFGQL